MLFRVLTAWLLLGSPSFAQMGQAPHFVQPLVSAGYVGPGDTNGSALYFHGFIGYSAAYSAPGTNKAANLCDAATGLICQDFNILSTGKFDTASAATFCALHTSCIVNVFYDQSGNGFDDILAGGVLSAAPAYTAASIGSCPVGTFTTSNQMQSAVATPFTQAMPFTSAIVVKRTSAPALGLIAGNISAPGSIFFSSNANAVALFAGSVTSDVTATDNVAHALQGFFDATGSASSLAVDGSTTTGLAPGNTGYSSTELTINNSSFPWAGAYLYDGLWAGNKSANSATLSTNVHSLCGF